MPSSSRCATKGYGRDKDQIGNEWKHSESSLGAVLQCLCRLQVDSRSVQQRDGRLRIIIRNGPLLSAWLRLTMIGWPTRKIAVRQLLLLIWWLAISMSTLLNPFQSRVAANSAGKQS